MAFGPPLISMVTGCLSNSSKSFFCASSIFCLTALLRPLVYFIWRGRAACTSLRVLRETDLKAGILTNGFEMDSIKFHAKDSVSAKVAANGEFLTVKLYSFGFCNSGVIRSFNNHSDLAFWEKDLKLRV